MTDDPNGKRYPTDERSKFDAALDEANTPSKPCAKRIAVIGVAITWCKLPDGHNGWCTGVVPRELKANTFGPEQARRRRW